MVALKNSSFTLPQRNRSAKSFNRIAFVFFIFSFHLTHFISAQESTSDSKVICSNGLTIALKQGKYGLLNEQGKNITAFKYDAIDFDTEDALGLVKKKDKYGLMNRSGKLITSVIYDDIVLYNQGSYAVLERKERLGFVSKKGKVTAIKYDDIEIDENIDFIVVRKKDRYGLLDKNGKKLTPLKYEQIEILDYSLRETEELEEQILRVFKNKKYGLLNPKGVVVAPLKFYEIKDYFDSYGLAICILNLQKKLPERNSFFEYNATLWEVVNQHGKTILPSRFDYIELIDSPYDFTYFKVSKYQDKYYHYNENQGVFSLDGKELVPPIFDTIEVNAEYEVIEVEKTGFKGIYDLEGRVIVPVKYDAIEYFDKHLFKVNRNGLYGFLDANGTEVIPLEYMEDEIKTKDQKFFILNKNIGDIEEVWKEVN